VVLVRCSRFWIRWRQETGNRIAQRIEILGQCPFHLPVAENFSLNHLKIVHASLIEADTALTPRRACNEESCNDAGANNRSRRPCYETGLAEMTTFPLPNIPEIVSKYCACHAKNTDGFEDEPHRELAAQKMVENRHEIADDGKRCEEKREREKPLSYTEFRLPGIARNITIEEQRDEEIDRKQNDERCRRTSDDIQCSLPILERVWEEDIDVLEEERREAPHTHVKGDHEEEIEENVSGGGFHAPHPTLSRWEREYLHYNASMRILLAMSGGIDSSVVAHLLKEHGHELVGVRFTLWSDPLAPAMAQILPSKCCNAQTAARAKSVASTLGIPYHIRDLEEEFKREVVDPFLNDYQKGLTPNPCVRCNRTIKFGKLLEIADELGCEKIATGHYARVKRGRDTQYHLLEAIDKAKDQSYYLYGLTQEQLSRVLFPLGTMHKHEVYALAEHYSIPFERSSYRESQDLCFFPEKTPSAFLKRHLQDKLQEGSITRRDGTIVGTHKGLPMYTVGQRRGLGIGGLKIPLEIVQKNCSNNTLVVAEQGTEKISAIHITDIRWVSWQPPQDRAISFTCRTRSLSPKRSGEFHYQGMEGIFQFSAPQPPHAPGQHIVLYQGEEIVGGGVIDNTSQAT